MLKINQQTMTMTNTSNNTSEDHTIAPHAPDGSYLVRGIRVSPIKELQMDVLEAAIKQQRKQLSIDSINILIKYGDTYKGKNTLPGELMSSIASDSADLAILEGVENDKDELKGLFMEFLLDEYNAIRDLLIFLQNSNEDVFKANTRGANPTLVESMTSEMKRLCDKVFCLRYCLAKVNIPFPDSRQDPLLPLEEDFWSKITETRERKRALKASIKQQRKQLSIDSFNTLIEHNDTCELPLELMSSLATNAANLAVLEGSGEDKEELKECIMEDLLAEYNATRNLVIFLQTSDKVVFKANTREVQTDPTLVENMTLDMERLCKHLVNARAALSDVSIPFPNSRQDPLQPLEQAFWREMTRFTKCNVQQIQSELLHLWDKDRPYEKQKLWLERYGKVKRRISINRRGM